MGSVLHKELRRSLSLGGLRTRALRVGTDCAGAETPVFALREIAQWAASAGEALEVDHLFSCDVSTVSRAFIMRNCAPRALFCDLLARERISHCLLAGGPRVVPHDLDLYVAGFPCKDFSMLNSGRPCMDGPHAHIFHGVVRYIRRHRPRVFLLENVVGLTYVQRGEEAPIREVMEELRSLGHYDVEMWHVNTKDFFLPQFRQRIYIVGVNRRKAALRKPLGSWQAALDKLRQEPEMPAQAFLLDEDSPEVRQAFQHHTRRAERGARRPDFAPWQVGQAGTQRARACQRGRPAAQKRRAAAWIERHRLVRMQRGLGSAQPVTGEGRGWARFLSPRARDMLDIEAHRFANAVAGERAEESHGIVELGRSLGFAGVQHRIVPTIVPNSRAWVFSRGRWFIGREMMALQGFPADRLDLRGLTNGDVMSLAGNAMSVPVVGAFLYLILSFVVFHQDQAPSSPAAPGQARRAPARREELPQSSPASQAEASGQADAQAIDLRESESCDAAQSVLSSPPGAEQSPAAPAEASEEPLRGSLASADGRVPIGEAALGRAAIGLGLRPGAPGVRTSARLAARAQAKEQAAQEQARREQARREGLREAALRVAAIEGSQEAARATAPKVAREAAMPAPRSPSPAGGPRDPCAPIPFALLDDDSGVMIECDGCGQWLGVHEEVAAIYSHPQNLSFFCSYLTGAPCSSAKRRAARRGAVP